MSYDIRIAVKVAGADEDMYAVIAEPELHSPTYNLGEMFRACTGWDYEQSEFYNVEEVYPKIERGIYELTYNEKEYERYNPENGWGSISSALKALQSMKQCIDEIEAPDCWSGWNTIPKQYLYIAW